MTIASHTLVRNGMPFIEPVLRQVLPFMNRCLITLSVKSNDGTEATIKKLMQEFPTKIFLDYEDVKNKSDLTQERQKQVSMTSEDWILFLDDDDWWGTDELISITQKINQDSEVYAISCHPYQIVDKEYYDANWNERWFCKFFKNKDINYRRPWPRDMVFSGKKSLYWRYNPEVVKIKERYYHLSYIKPASFRNEEWAKKYKEHIGERAFIPISEQDNINKIFSYL